MRPSRLAALEARGDAFVDGKFMPVVNTESNQEHRNRLDFWKVELQHCCADNHWLSLSVRQMQQAYTRANGNYPKCIGRAVHELEREGVLVPEARALGGASAAPTGASVLSALVSPFRWAFGSGSAAADADSSGHAVAHVEPTLDERFVLRSALERAATAVLADLRATPLVTQKGLDEVLQRHCTNASDCALLVRRFEHAGDIARLDDDSVTSWRVGHGDEACVSLGDPFADV